MRYNCNNFPWWELAMCQVSRRKPGTRIKGGDRFNYLDVISAFDIETSRLADIEQAIMYIWQWHFDGIGTLIGRTWDEFKDACEHIEHICNHKWGAKYNIKVCVWVHNLSYEFSFLQGIYPFADAEVFAIKSRKVLKCNMLGCLEFRCSYLHSNMSLDLYCKKMGVNHKKLKGYDYNKVRYPWTPLTDFELDYCCHDVIGLCEAIKAEMRADGDDLYTIPLTSTGYVRRDCKRAMHDIRPSRVTPILPTFEEYEMLREAFRGGNTHANRYYAGKVLHDVHSADRTSSYPDVICNCEFPVRQWQECAIKDLKDLMRQLTRGKALLMRIALADVALLDPFWGAPYLSRDKCRRIENGVFDNGRILSADYIETTITDIDLKIIISEYDFSSCVVIKSYCSTYGKLPQELRNTVIHYYVTKTALKGVEGGDNEILYTKSKNKLNSIYGMMAQDPVKENMLYAAAQWVVDESKTPEELLLKNNKGAFLSYSWGVWVTAWARLRLEEGIRLAGGKFVYADTDSVKYMGDIDWTEYNDKRIADSVQSGAHATDRKGVEHYMGVYEPEDDYTEFCTLGAKKYAYRHAPKIKSWYSPNNAPLEITIAGVGKAAGAKELEAAGGLKAFKAGFVFVDGGGLESVYNDKPTIGTIEREGHKLTITSNVMLRPSTYKLGITGEYEMLLDRCAEFFERNFSYQVETD